eukprot:5499960-Amphidinium_carterae.1
MTPLMCWSHMGRLGWIASMLFVVADAEVVTGTQRFRIQSVSSNCNGVLCMGGPGLYHAMPLDYIPPAPSAADMLDIVQAASM